MKDTQKLIADLNSFDDAWEDGASAGYCDGFGGMEYRRVRGEWIEAGRDPGITLAAFIRARANAGPLPG